MAKPKKPKPLAQMSQAERDKRIAQLVKNPGTRHAIPTQYLPEPYRQKRELNARLAQPIVPGSSTTNLELARAAKAAGQEKYGAAEGAARQDVGAQQQRQTDLGGWFDQYLREVAQHATNVAGAQQQAQGQVANLGNVTGGPAPTDPQNQDIANKAAAIRQGLLGAMQGQLVGQGQASSTYADLLAHVVAPGQKVQALTGQAGVIDKARQALQDLLGQEGAYRTDYKAQARTDEAKNVLAQQALTGTQAHQSNQDKTAAAAIDIKRGVDPVTGKPLPKASTPKTGYQPGGPALNKYGYTYDEWKALSPKEQAAARAGKDKPKKPTDPATQDAKDFYAKYGVQPAKTAAVDAAKNDIQTASSYVDELKKAGWTRQQIGQALLQGVQADKKKNQKGYPKQKALWLTVALDLAWLNGRISAGTAKRLHSAGYSVKVLGLNTGAPTVTGPKDLPSGGTGTGGTAPPK